MLYAKVQVYTQVPFSAASSLLLRIRVLLEELQPSWDANLAIAAFPALQGGDTVLWHPPQHSKP